MALAMATDEFFDAEEKQHLSVLADRALFLRGRLNKQAATDQRNPFLERELQATQYVLALLAEDLDLPAVPSLAAPERRVRLPVAKRQTVEVYRRGVR